MIEAEARPGLGSGGDTIAIGGTRVVGVSLPYGTIEIAQATTEGNRVTSEGAQEAHGR